MLFITILFNTDLSYKEKSELFLEIYGNLMIREKSKLFLNEQCKTLIEYFLLMF